MIILYLPAVQISDAEMLEILTHRVNELEAAKAGELLSQDDKSGFVSQGWCHRVGVANTAMIPANPRK